MSDTFEPHPDIVLLVEALAEFLAAEQASGRTLTAGALAARASRHFVGCSALIVALRGDIAREGELTWAQLQPADLASRMRALPQFASLALAHGVALDDIAHLTYELSGEVDDPDHRRALQVSLDAHRAALPRLVDAARFRRALAAPRHAPAIEPQIDSAPELARRLEISIDELDAAVRLSRSARAWQLMILHKRSGGVRIIEQPKDALRVLQRRIQRHVLCATTGHPAAHGFIRGRSPLTHATLHTGRRVVIRLDIADFFTSISAGRVHSAFLRLGLPPRVASVLTSLTTSAQRAGALRAALRQDDASLPQSRVDERTRELQETLCLPHLPQGAPTSPALANWIAHRLDLRLGGLAAAWSMRYSRYADDLTFSSDDASLDRHRFVDAVRTIVASEGWLLNERKTLVMPQSTRQRVTGIVVNQAMNLCRKDFDALKAAVHRHVATTPHDDASCSRLLGRIAWLAQFRPQRAAKLKQKLLVARP